MVVKVDGEIVPHVNNDCRGEPYCMGLITFQIPAGMHTLEIRLISTLPRKMGDIISLLSLGAVILIIFKKK